MASVIDILKFAGQISLADLSKRASNDPAELAKELQGLQRDGMIDIQGPLTDSLDEAFTPHRLADAAKTTVEPSYRGYRYILPR
jgi:hypothetical protein